MISIIDTFFQKMFLFLIDFDLNTDNENILFNIFLDIVH